MRYASKDGLVADIVAEHDDLMTLLGQTSTSSYAARGVSGDGWTITDLVAHLAEWQAMFLSWYDTGRTGAIPTLPAPGYKWNETPQLNRAIQIKHRSRSAAEVLTDFDAGYERILHLVKHSSREELFTPGYYAWTGKHPLTTYLTPNTASHYRFASKVLRRWHRQGLRPHGRAGLASGRRRTRVAAKSAALSA